MRVGVPKETAEGERRVALTPEVIKKLIAKGKRPKMGAVAALLSDFCILTSDNPRTEDPHRILLDVEVGMQRAEKRKGDGYMVIEAREEAIRKAVSLARPGDLVMIAGKGHENYQIIGTERRHFDDREEAMAALKSRAG